MSHKPLYLKLFQPPKFLKMSAVCLEISSDGISFLLAVNNSLGVTPDIYGKIPLAPGVFSNGKIIKREPIVKAISDIKKKTKVSFARFSLPEEDTYIFKTHLPKLSSKEIQDVLYFKIEENVPLKAKEAVFDYDTAPNSGSHSSGLEVVVSVSPQSVIEEFQSILTEGGLTPIFFCAESSNVSRSIVKKNNQQNILIVNIKKSSVIFSLAVSGIVYQTSSINFGSSTFTDLLAKYLNIPMAEALKIKKEKLYSENAENMDLFSYLINTISAIKDEIYKFMVYCNGREDIPGQVDRIILCGQDAMIVGLDKYLSDNLSLEVDVANIWVNNFDLNLFVPKISKLESLDLGSVNGLSLL
jgi:type IV pilus assembly protein PilM